MTLICFRSYFQILKLDSDIKNETLFAINGKIQGAKNTVIETFRKDKWIQSSVGLPAMINLFCVAFRDSKTILIAGGFQNDSYSTKTYFLSLVSMTWSQGPDVFTPVSYAQCGRLISSRVPIIE